MANDDRRFRIIKMGNTDSCPCGHRTHYRLITTDGLSSYCMICFALGWHDPNISARLALTGRKTLPEMVSGPDECEECGAADGRHHYPGCVKSE